MTLLDAPQTVEMLRFIQDRGSIRFRSTNSMPHSRIRAAGTVI